MYRARFWILCAMVGLLVISGALLFGSRYFAMHAKSLKNRLPIDVDMRLDHLVLNQAGNDNRSMTIQADSAQYFKTRDVFVLDKVRAKVLTDQGYYDIEADTGNYDQGKRMIDLLGHARVADGEGGVLVSEAMTLNFNDDVLTSDVKFCYATPTADLSGRSFVFYTREKLLKVEGRTHLLLQ
ncbi:MAG: LPS export ABC transporter periplasmic protein LptC [Candidatus Adiutrix sp.]|jgi:LPS export ABC transporter protein LptC|nr:LPS export ABC transporter periplasmic protein LptC [Candidatus Adiutrix sp.]